MIHKIDNWLMDVENNRIEIFLVVIIAVCISAVIVAFIVLGKAESKRLETYNRTVFGDMNSCIEDTFYYKQPVWGDTDTMDVLGCLTQAGYSFSYYGDPVTIEATQ